MGDDIIQHAVEIGRQRRLEGDSPVVGRYVNARRKPRAETDARAASRLAGCPAPAGDAAIDGVADDWMSDGIEVDTNLMRAQVAMPTLSSETPLK